MCVCVRQFFNIYMYIYVCVCVCVILYVLKAYMYDNYMNLNNKKHS